MDALDFKKVGARRDLGSAPRWARDAAVVEAVRNGGGLFPSPTDYGSGPEERRELPQATPTEMEFDASYVIQVQRTCRCAWREDTPTFSCGIAKEDVR